MEVNKFIIVISLIMSSLSISYAQVKLSYNPVEGSKYEYQTEVVQNIKQSAMGRDLNIEETVIMGFLINHMKKITGSEVQFTYQDVLYDLSSPMLQMRHGTKNQIENPSELDKILEKIFSGVVGKSFTLSIASDGSVNSITGMEAISEGITKVVSGFGQMGEQLSASMIDQWLGETAIKGMVEQSLKIYPAGVVQPGDSWMTESKYGISNKRSIIKTKYTLKNIENDVATINMAATAELEPGGGLEGTLTGTQSGFLLIDIKTGVPALSDLTLNIRGVVKSNDLEMLMEMKAKIKTSIKEIQ